MKDTKVPDMMQFFNPAASKEQVPGDQQLFQSLMDEAAQSNPSEIDPFYSMPANTNNTYAPPSGKKDDGTWLPPYSYQTSSTSEQHWPVLPPQGNEFKNPTTGDDVEIDINKDGKGGWGDPHFDVTGSNGERIKFDHKGVDGHKYHLFSGDNINITGTYVPASDPKEPQVIGNASIHVGQDLIDFSKDGKTMLNGNEIENGKYQLAGGGTLENKGNALAIIPEDGTGIVDLYAKMSGLRIDPSGKFSGLDGIIGKAIALSRGLSDEECEAFDVTRYLS